MGSERGELSSTQDTNEWKEYVQAKRQTHANPHIIKPFIDKCIQFKVLPTYKEKYTTKWNDLFSSSEKERVEIGRIRATSIKEYFSMPMAETVIPPKAFMQFCLGLSDADIELILKMVEEDMNAEEIARRYLETQEIEEEGKLVEE